MSRTVGRGAFLMNIEKPSAAGCAGRDPVGGNPYPCTLGLLLNLIIAVNKHKK